MSKNAFKDKGALIHLLKFGKYGFLSDFQLYFPLNLTAWSLLKFGKTCISLSFFCHICCSQLNVCGTAMFLHFLLLSEGRGTRLTIRNKNQRTLIVRRAGLSTLVRPERIHCCRGNSPASSADPDLRANFASSTAAGGAIHSSLRLSKRKMGGLVGY